MIKRLSILWLVGFLLAQISYAAPEVSPSSPVRIQHANIKKETPKRHKQKGKHSHRKHVKEIPQNQVER